MSVSIHQDPGNEDRLMLTLAETGILLGHIFLNEEGLRRKPELLSQLALQPGEKPSYHVLGDVAELTGALESLVTEYVANIGTPSEFISCITPDDIPWYWVRAKQAIERGQGRLRRAKNG